MATEYEVVKASFERCLESVDFFDAFYDLFLSKSAEIPPLFVDTDFVRQKQVLGHSINYMLSYACGTELSHEILDDIADIHSRDQRNILPKFYPIWLDSLCETIKQYDPEWTQQLEQQWRQAMKPGIDLMVAAY